MISRKKIVVFCIFFSFSLFRFSLEHHINKIHDKVKRYPCSNCSDSFYDSRSLKIHSEKHKNNVLFGCNTCLKKFNTKTLLKRHVKTIHEKSEIYQCELCDFKSHHQTSLTTHVKNIHKKLKNHHCEFCDEKFHYKKSLDKHLLNVHQSETTVTVTVEHY